MQLSEYGSSLALEIAFWLQGLEDPEYALSGLGNLSLELTDKFQALAFMVLLTHGDIQLYREHLVRSAKARITYLERIHKSGITDDHHYAASRYTGLLGAIAAVDVQSIRSIVDMTPRRWQKGREYVDDYCFARIMGYFATQVHQIAAIDKKELSELLQEYEHYLDGQFDPRFQLCQALANCNQTEFDDAFESLLEAHENHIILEKERGFLIEVVPYALQQISITGLAILSLAVNLGFQTDQNYKYCPAIARISI